MRLKRSALPLVWGRQGRVRRCGLACSASSSAEAYVRKGKLRGQSVALCRVGAHNAVVGADQGFRAPSWDRESVRDSVHEDSARSVRDGRCSGLAWRSRFIRRRPQSAFHAVNHGLICVRWYQLPSELVRKSQDR